MKTLDPAVIAFANDAFYLAFNNGDIKQMDELWARDSPTVCIHPGWAPLLDRDEIILSWENIFAGTGDRELFCHEARVLAVGGLYTVICYEQLPGGWLVATNSYVLEDGVVRIVHHQASQCMEPPELDGLSPTLQ